MLDWDTAVQAIKSIEGCKLEDPDFLRAKRELMLAAMNYARARTNDYLHITAKTKTANSSRTQLHNHFILAYDNLSKYMEKQGVDNSWRGIIGNDRKVIGDFACYIHCILGLGAR